MHRPGTDLSPSISLSTPGPIAGCMHTFIDIHREGKFVVATDLLTNIADQGLSETEARENLKRGLEEHYRLLVELLPAGHTLGELDIGVEQYVRHSPAFVH